MSHAATAAEYEAREPYQSQVHTWGDASILALLLAADYSWLVEDTEVNQLTLPLVLAWSLFITYAAFVERRANPDEFIVASTTALWCFGNAFWTLTDFAWWEWEAARREAEETGDGHDLDDPSAVTYAGVRMENVRLLDTLVGVCFAVAFAVGVAYFAHFRYTDAFVAARRARGDGVAGDYSETASVEDEEDEEDAKPALRCAERRARRETRLNAGDPFLGPAFMPNVLNVQSRAEYESLSHFLWIFNDLCLYFAVEFEEILPKGVALFAKALMVTVAFWLIAHSVDALVVARRDAVVVDAFVIDAEGNAFVVDDTAFDPESFAERRHDREMAGAANGADVQKRAYKPLDAETVTKLCTLFWVVAMTVWSFGDMFAPDPDSRIGVEVDLFSLDAGKNVEGPESSRWWAAWCMMVGVVALALFWGSELFAMALRAVAPPPRRVVLAFPGIDQ
jgi:hypothetical protein